MAQAVAITLGDQVRLRFHGWPETVKSITRDGTEIDVPHPKAGEPYRMTWNSRPYIVHPGADIFIPFELAKKEFGDPRSLENVYRIKDEWGGEQIVPDRFAEVRRLQNYWQNSVVRFREYIPGDRTFMAEGISDLLPKVEIFAMTGERILMVTDDPYGDTVVVEARTRAEESASQVIMQQQSDAIAELRRTNQLLLKKLGLSEEALGSLEEGSTHPRPQPGNLETPLDATTEEAPSRMVFNPRTRKVEPYAVGDPTSTDINHLPPDNDN